jgi:hypothetical protein
MPHGRARELERLDPGRQRGEQRLGFQPGDVLADALVQPESEADVARRVARQVKPVGVGPAAGVAVDRGEERRRPRPRSRSPYRRRPRNDQQTPVN